MIQANELRIGNWYVQYGSYYKVTPTTLRDLFYTTKPQGWCRPIPLTEDILLKCGGERDEHNDVFVYLDKTHDLRLYLTNGFIQQCKSYYSPLSNYPHITHLHQLQNLYFALTQQELTIDFN